MERFTHSATTAELALVDVATDFLHEADNATPKLSVAAGFDRSGNERVH